MTLRLFLLGICRLAGLFSLARYLTRRQLRVLCYHGFAIEDEHRFRPSLFMTGELFERRLEYLRRHRYNVLGLGDAVRLLNDGGVPPSTVVITIDDGFYSVYRIALPLLRKYDMPATLYVTSYYVKHASPVFRIAVQYLFWKTARPVSDLGDLGPGLPSSVEIRSEEGDRAMWQLIDYAESRLEEPARLHLLERVADRLNVDYRRICESRICSLVNGRELAVLEECGVSIQLHTHRHRMPDSASEIADEIARNRDVLRPWIRGELVHFCYPSGVWSPDYWPILTELGVSTATTCVPGLNGRGTHPLALRRFLDRQDFPDVEFEAEISGFKALARRLLLTA